MPRKRVDRGQDYAFLVHRPDVPLTLVGKTGKCSVCGAVFTGPKNRKYCNLHSKYTKFSGRG